MTAAVFQMLAALGVVLGLIWALSQYMKKRARRSGHMSLIEYMNFGPKKGIALVRLGKKVMVLGVTPTDLKLFKTIPDGELASGTFDTVIRNEIERKTPQTIGGKGE